MAGLGAALLGAALGAAAGILVGVVAWLLARKGSPVARAKREAAEAARRPDPAEHPGPPPDYAREIQVDELGARGVEEVDIYMLEAPIAGASPAELEAQAQALAGKLPGGSSVNTPQLSNMMHAGLGAVCRLKDGGVIYRSWNMEAKSGMTSALLPSLSELKRASVTGGLKWSNKVMVVELLPDGPYAWHGPGRPAENPYWEEEKKVFSAVPVATFETFLNWARQYPEDFPLYRGCRLVKAPTRELATDDWDGASIDTESKSRVLLEANTCGSFVLRAFTHLASLGAKPLRESDGTELLVRINLASLFTKEESISPCSPPQLKRWAGQALQGLQAGQVLKCTAEAEMKAAEEAAAGKSKGWLRRRVRELRAGASSSAQLVRLRALVMNMGGRMILPAAEDPSQSYLIALDAEHMCPPAYVAVPAVGTLSYLPGRQRTLAALKAATAAIKARILGSHEDLFAVAASALHAPAPPPPAASAPPG